MGERKRKKARTSELTFDFSFLDEMDPFSLVDLNLPVTSSLAYKNTDPITMTRERIG